MSGNVKVELSRDGGGTWTVLFGSTANDGTQDWKVTTPATSQALVRVSSVNNPSVSDTSNAVFSIGGGRVTVLTPNGGEIWPIGSTQTIQWSATGITGTVKVELSRDGGTTWAVLFASTANDGTQNWKVTTPMTNQARIRISSVKDASAVDTSDGGFTLGGGNITVLTPNGGEVWSINSTKVIQWSASGITGNVKIELSRDGGTTWVVLFASTANDGGQNWKVTGPTTNQARIRVSGVKDTSVFDSSDGLFVVQ